MLRSAFALLGLILSAQGQDHLENESSQDDVCSPRVTISFVRECEDELWGLCHNRKGTLYVDLFCLDPFGKKACLTWLKSCVSLEYLLTTGMELHAPNGADLTVFIVPSETDKDDDMSSRSIVQSTIHIPAIGHHWRELPESPPVPSIGTMETPASAKQFQQDAVASHQPVLVAAVTDSSGPVVEFGMGWFSTVLLHEVCAYQNKTLLSLESDAEWFKHFTHLETEFHRLMLVKDYEQPEVLELYNKNWGVAFMDSGPAPARLESTRRIQRNAEYVILHDSDYYSDFFMLDQVPSVQEFLPARPWPEPNRGPPVTVFSHHRVVDLRLDFYNATVDPSVQPQHYGATLPTRPSVSNSPHRVEATLTHMPVVHGLLRHIHASAPPHPDTNALLVVGCVPPLVAWLVQVARDDMYNYQITLAASPGSLSGCRHLSSPNLHLETTQTSADLQNLLARQRWRFVLLDQSPWFERAYGAVWALEHADWVVIHDFDTLLASHQLTMQHFRFHREFYPARPWPGEMGPSTLVASNTLSCDIFVDPYHFDPSVDVIECDDFGRKCHGT